LNIEQEGFLLRCSSENARDVISHMLFKCILILTQAHGKTVHPCQLEVHQGYMACFGQKI
jgi:hypothetical protein